MSNGLVALVLAGVPLYGALGGGDPVVLAITIVWAVLVLGFTLYRLLTRGYLPGAGRVARATGLHERIGPGAHASEHDAEGSERAE